MGALFGAAEGANDAELVLGVESDLPPPLPPPSSPPLVSFFCRSRVIESRPSRTLVDAEDSGFDIIVRVIVDVERRSKMISSLQ